MGDRIYLGACPGAFYSLDRLSGEIAWSHDTTLDGDPASFHGEPLFVGNTLFVGSDNGSAAQLYAFDTRTGEVRWHLAEPGGFPSGAVKVGSRVIAISMSGEVCALDARSGKGLWRFGGNPGDSMLNSSLVVVGKRIAATQRGEVVLLDPASGQALWRRKLEGAPNTTLAVIDDSLYVGEREGLIHRLALEDGRPLGSHLGTAPIYGALVPAGDCLLALWGEDTLACLDRALETVRWSRTVQTNWSSHRVLVHGDLVVAGTEEGEIHAMNVETGEPRWVVQVEGPIKGLSTHGGVLYVGTQPGRLYALRFPGGS